MAALANSGTAGYIGGGFDGGYLSGIDKITFSSDSKSTLSATFNSERNFHASAANSGTAGYFAGGLTNGGNDLLSQIAKLTFSSDAVSVLSATLSSARAYLDGAANTGVAGYFAGGNTSAGSQTTIDKLTFSTETNSVLSATLAPARGQVATFADCGVF